MNTELLSTLRNAALTQIHVANAFAKEGRSYNKNGSRYFTYALLLENEGKNDKIYIGDTDNPYTRLLAHFEMSPSSAAWVKKFGPVRRILEITFDAPEGAEKERFLEYASIFGFPNVRGSWWCRTTGDSNAPFMLDEFERGKMSHKFLSRSEIKHIEKEIREIAAKRIVV
ncbi:GIY-YIG catalytic domain-containing endonuclease [Paramecium bursaria Chlorella virus NE-JV-1]|nr:GIY-YIG catalytic domain-containing endonuclease [Paramecium bursaria Chlorella virus NE-JV-1]